MNENISLETLRNALAVAEQIQQLQGRLGAIIGDGKSIPTTKKGPRKMSAAARAKIGAAQKARWAKVKGKKVSTTRKPIRNSISAAGRKKLSELMKARWAARKKQKAS